MIHKSPLHPLDSWEYALAEVHYTTVQDKMMTFENYP